jgi:N6-L-threonylcarbamoyladenine synthase
MERASPLNFFLGPVLGIETSCDETSAAITLGQEVLSNAVSSQIDLHAKWGGVVPEAAARAHVEAALPIIEEALQTAKISREDIQAIAVTNRPGLVGALSVGVTAAKALAYAQKISLIGVHHLEGHLSSILASNKEIIFPHVALIVSGGHTELVLVEEPLKYKLLGQTLDDAAGEAFDKGARLMGLGYPGGRAIQDASQTGNPRRYSLPKGATKDPLDFSFSGLKTATLRLVETEGDNLSIPDAAASLQEAIVGALCDKAIAALDSSGAEALALVGGVAANEELRKKLKEKSDKQGFQLYVPPTDLCTDNAAMIALAGSQRLARGEQSDWSLEVLPNADLP